MSWMPQNIATFGARIDDLTLTITVITMIALVLAEAFLVLAILRFRRKSGQRAQPIQGDRWSQLKWVFIPVLVVVALDLYIDVQNNSAWFEIKETLPGQGMVVGVTGEQFMWSFHYPGADGQLNTNDDIPAGELHVPTATNVTFELTAKDVLHSLWIPAMRLKQDALPGRIQKGWFQATVPGTFDIACAEICGDGHSKMAAKLVVQSQSDFDAWLANAQANPQPTNAQDLIKLKGCLGCHSTDGSPMVGPSWKGIFGRTETVLSNGAEHQVEADEDYLRKSILSPSADVVKGFPPVMPEMRDKLSDEQVTMIIQYLKTL